MKKYISLTAEWVEKNGQGSLEECVDVAKGKAASATPTSDPNAGVYYVCEVLKVVKKVAPPVIVEDVR